MNITKKGITATISKAGTILQTFDNNVMVSPGPDGYAEIEGYTPAFDGANGAIKNNRGYNEAPFGNTQIQLPVRLYPGDTLVISKKAVLPPNQKPRDAYWPGVTGRSVIDEMLAIVCTPFEHNNTEVFRAPALGNSIISTFFRSSPIKLSSIDLTKLPKAINYNSIQPLTKMSVEDFLRYLSDKFSDFCGDMYSGWSTDTRTPDFQNPGYGTCYSALVSQAMVALCLNIDNELKFRLARNMVQWGLDLAGAWGDGRFNYVNGGHMQGRKALIILAGILLNVEPLATPNKFVGNAFQEDDAYYYDENNAWWFGWKYGWMSHPGISRWLHKPPSQWTTGTYNEIWRTNGYMEHVIGSQIGTVLAMKLMNRSNDFGKNITGMVKQWMGPIDQSVKNELIAVGVNPRWGESYAVGLHYLICSTAWKSL